MQVTLLPAALDRDYQLQVSTVPRKQAGMKTWSVDIDNEDLISSLAINDAGPVNPAATVSEPAGPMKPSCYDVSSTFQAILP